MEPQDFKNYRKRLKISQTEAAENFGVSLRTFQTWERGESEIPKIAQKLLTLLLEKEAGTAYAPGGVACENGTPSAYNSAPEILQERLSAAEEKITLLKQIIAEKERLIQAIEKK